MTRTGPYTRDEDTQLNEMALTVPPTPIREQARRLDRTPGSVAARRHKLGIRSGNTALTAAATATTIANAKDARARLELDLLNDASRLRALIWTDTEYIDHVGREGTQVRWTQQPTAVDRLRLMQASRQALDGSLKITDRNGNGHLEEVKTGLGALFDAFKHAAVQFDDNGNCATCGRDIAACEGHGSQALAPVSHVRGEAEAR